MNFSDRFLVLHPTAFDLGRTIIVLGFIVIAVGVITSFKGQFLLPPTAWFAAAIPTLGVGTILVACSLTKLG